MQKHNRQSSTEWSQGGFDQGDMDDWTLPGVIATMRTFNVHCLHSRMPAGTHTHTELERLSNQIPFSFNLPHSCYDQYVVRETPPAGIIRKVLSVRTIMHAPCHNYCKQSQNTTHMHRHVLVDVAPPIIMTLHATMGTWRVPMLRSYEEHTTESTDMVLFICILLACKWDTRGPN